jgi:SSS family solute:Na+ symporter
MKVYSAAIIFVFLVPYSAAVYKGLGSLFTTIFPGADITVCMAIVAVLTAAYLVFGGYVATAYTDFVQGIIMIVGVVAMVVAIVYNPQVGGFSEAFSKISALGAEAGNFSLVSWFGGENWSFLLTNILLTSFGAWGLPQMVTKYYAIKDEKSIKTATVVSTLFALIIGCGAYFVGSLGRIYLGNQLPEAGYDAVVPQTLMQSLGMDGNLLTTIVLAVIMLLLLSASMSTLSSIVLTSSSAITVDFIPVVHPKFKLSHQMIATRVLCLVFVALSFFFATANITFIVNLMSFSWGVVAGCFMGPYLLGLYYKKTTKTAAWCGLLSGLLVVGVLTAVFTGITGSFGEAMSLAPEFGVAAFIVSILAVWLVSQFTKDVPRQGAALAFQLKTGDETK